MGSLNNYQPIATSANIFSMGDIRVQWTPFSTCRAKFWFVKIRTVWPYAYKYMYVIVHIAHSPTSLYNYNQLLQHTITLTNKLKDNFIFWKHSANSAGDGARDLMVSIPSKITI